MREVLSCRTPGQAVPLPDRFRSLKAWLLEGLAYSPELLQCLRYYLFPPRHSSFGRWGWFCLHLRWWVRGSWGREASWIHQCSHSLGWGESRGRALPHSLAFGYQDSPKDTCLCGVHGSLLILGLLSQKSPSDARSRKILWKERSQATETFPLSVQLSSCLFFYIYIYIFQSLLF